MHKSKPNQADVEKFKTMEREHEKLERVENAERRKPQMLSRGKGKKTKDWQC